MGAIARVQGTFSIAPVIKIPNEANECKQHAALGASTFMVNESPRHWKRQKHYLAYED